MTAAPPSRTAHRLGREDVKRIRQRHRGYRLLLLTISAVVLIQPLARQWPFITPVMAILMALVMMLFLTRYSPLQANKRLLYGLGMAAITCELLWLIVLVTDFSLAQHLAIMHLLVWGTFISTFLLRKAKALKIESANGHVPWFKRPSPALNLDLAPESDRSARELLTAPLPPSPGPPPRPCAGRAGL